MSGPFATLLERSSGGELGLSCYAFRSSGGTVEGWNEVRQKAGQTVRRARSVEPSRDYRASHLEGEGNLHCGDMVKLPARKK